MSEWKYVMFEANGKFIPILFPGQLVHEKVARQMGYALREHVITERPDSWSSLHSAGFVSGLAITGVNGKSESLNNLSSRDADTSIINLMPYSHGVYPFDNHIEKLLLLKLTEQLIDRIQQL